MNDEYILDEQELAAKPKKYPKWLKVIETILIVIGVIGYGFKYMHWKGGDFLLLISLGVLSILYLTLFFTLDRTQYAKKGQKGLMVFGGFILSTAVLGILYRLFLWQGGDAFVLCGYPSIILGLIVSFWFIKKLISQKDARRMASRFLIIGSIAVYLHQLPIRTQVERNYEGQASEQLLDAFEDQYNNPTDQKKEDRYIQLRDQHFDSLNRLEYGDEYLD